MKKLLISCCLFPILCFAAPKKIAPPVKAPIVEVAPEPEVSLDDLYKTVEHIQKLAKEQQIELDKAKTENESIKTDLEVATQEYTRAQNDADTLQVQVNKVTDDRNEQARQKDAALDKVDAQKKEITKLTAEIHKLKFIICTEAALLALFILLWLGALKWFSPWVSLGFLVGVPTAVFWIVWALL